MKRFLVGCLAVATCFSPSFHANADETVGDLLRLPVAAKPLHPPVPLASDVPGSVETDAVGTVRPQLAETVPSPTSAGPHPTGLVDTSLPPGLMPPDPAAEFFSQQAVYVPRNETPQSPLRFSYANPALGFCHQPLYFEQVRLERYGTVRRCPTLLSAAHFFGTIPVLPYKMTVVKPREKICTFGLRSGFGTSYSRKDRHRLAVTAQAAVATGLIFALP